MKARPQKVGNPGKVGQVAGKSGKKAPQSAAKMPGIDRVTMGSAMGILGKHFK